MIDLVLRLLFPPKCVLCQKLLGKGQDDLCPVCRQSTREFSYAKKNISFIAGWTALWYYEEDVRNSLVRFKFCNKCSYAVSYGRLLAMRLLQDEMVDFDLLTWVPISELRLHKRGYDQVKLLSAAVGRVLKVKPRATLRKIRHTPAQSTLSHISARRANVLGAYRAIDPSIIQGKRILLLDDIITTGATASECARILLTAGAKEVIFAAVAATDPKKNAR